MNNSLIVLAVFFSAMLFIQKYMKKSIRLLSIEDKARLMDLSSDFMMWRMIPIVVILFGFAGFMYFKPSISVLYTGLVIYMILIFGSAVTSSYVIQKKYQKMNFPQSYIRTARNCAILRLALLVSFLLYILIPIVEKNRG